MSGKPAELNSIAVIKRAFGVAIRPENLLVLLLGAAIVALGSLFSAFVLAGPLGVGYADACVKMVRGRRAELDDIFWRGFDRLKPAFFAGIILGPATTAAMFVLLVPGLMVLGISALVYLRLATSDDETLTGFGVLKEIRGLLEAHGAALAVTGLVLALIGAVLSLTVVGSVVAVGFIYLAATFVFAHYYPAELTVPEVEASSAAA